MSNENEFSNSLDPVLVQRANDSSVAFNFGDSIAHNYKQDLIEIVKMQHLDEAKKTLALKEIHALRTAELSSQGKAVGPNVYGPAVVNPGRDSGNFDAAIEKRLSADRFMDSLRQKEEKYKILKRHADLVGILQKAAEQGQKETIVNGKTFYLSGKYWTTKKPKERKAGGRSR